MTSARAIEAKCPDTGPGLFSREDRLGPILFWQVRRGRGACMEQARHVVCAAR